MVAYSFKARFADDLAAGRKRQTIRKIGRRRHARPGDKIQIYIGMRTKHCRKVRPDATCSKITEIKIVVDDKSIAIGWHIGTFQHILSDEEMDAFARADGFTDAEDMRKFWIENHGKGVHDDLVLIQWED